MNIVQSMLRQIAGLPMDKWFIGVTIGFVGGMIFWTCVAIFYNIWEPIDYTQTMTRIAALLGIVVLAQMGNKRWLGDRWCEQHWFHRITVLVGYSCAGFVPSILVYNILVYMFIRR